MSRLPYTRLLGVALAATGLVGLAGCGEKPQTATGSKKLDAKAWESNGTAYTAPGWKQGDRDSWEQQLKARNQSQNEYQRTR